LRSRLRLRLRLILRYKVEVKVYGCDQGYLKVTVKVKVKVKVWLYGTATTIGMLCSHLLWNFRQDAHEGCDLRAVDGDGERDL
jgi:hypothetical protein